MVETAFPYTPAKEAYKQRTVVLLDTTQSGASKDLAGMLRENGVGVELCHTLDDALDYMEGIKDETPVLFAANEGDFPYQKYRGGITTLEMARRGSKTVDGVLLVHGSKFNTQKLREHTGRRISGDFVVPLNEVAIESAANILRQLAATGQSLDYHMLLGDLVQLN